MRIMIQKVDAKNVNYEIEIILAIQDINNSF